MQLVQTPQLQIRFPRQPDDSENKTTKPGVGGWGEGRGGRDGGMGGNLSRAVTRSSSSTWLVLLRHDRVKSLQEQK